MAAWTVLDDEVAAGCWDEQLARFDHLNYCQCYAWGEHRRATGWTPLRCVARDAEGEWVAMTQVLYKSQGLGSVAVWSNGGPVGDVSAWDESLREAVRNATGAKRVYFRFLSHRPTSEEVRRELRAGGWKRSSFKLRSGLSLQLKLDKDPEEIEGAFSRDWRYNLRKFDEQPATIHRWDRPKVDEILALYRSMEDAKDLDEQFSRPELEGLFDTLGDKLLFYRCDAGDGEPIAFRGCIHFDRFAWDVFAATSARGREVRGASNALFRSLILRCRELGVTDYDLMGVDPEGNPGVFKFKQGSGAKPIEYLGEWEWSKPFFLGSLANLALRWRRPSF